MPTNTDKHNQIPGKKVTLTSRVIEAIQSGCSTLREIAEYTDICYRSVNALVTSLEMQARVKAQNYRIKRGDQQFVVIHAGKNPSRRSVLLDHPRNHQNPANSLSLLHEVFGIGQHPTSFHYLEGTGSVRVHRLF